jgi:polyisoprenoid-binding protein YceI
VALYGIIPERSYVWVDARSSVHPIHSKTNGLEGFVNFELTPGGEVDLASTPAGALSLSVDRLSSGNAMQDRELRRRIDAARFPKIDGVLAQMVPSGTPGKYRVSGEVIFRGVTRRYDDEMTVAALDADALQLAGKSRFDIRDFGMEPPRVLMFRVEPEVDVTVEIIAVRRAR